MSYNLNTNGDASSKFSVNSTVLEAVLECDKILSHTRMEEEERMKILGKLFVVLGDTRKESLQQPNSKGEDTNPDKSNNSESFSQKDCGQVLSRCMEKGDDQERAILHFLHNVISQDALVCKNMNIVLQGLHDSKLVKSSEVINMLKQSLPHREVACSNKQNNMEINGNFAEKEASMESLKSHGPEVNNHGTIHSAVVPKDASVSRNKEISFTSAFQNSKDNSTAGHDSTAQVRGSTPFYPSDTYGKMGIKDSTILKNSNFSDMHSKKGEICQPFQTFNFKEGETSLPCVSYSNIVKYGKENFCPQRPRQFEKKVEDPNFSDFRHSLNKDDSSLFRIDPSILEKRMEMCSLSVVGKVTLAKGDTPWLLRKLRERIESIWSLKSDWRLISLGKGFYHILLKSKEEWDKVWSHGHTSLKPGVLRLQRWSLDFDPIKEKNSNAQVWFRILNLPWCLWEPSVLAGIARKVGVPIRFDKATVESDFGHFARVLVDVDLSKPFRNSVHVEYGYHVFEVQIVPENVPAFCRNCHAIGHFSMDCKFVRNKEVEPFSTTINNQKAEGKETRTNKVPLETFSNENVLSFDASIGKSAEASSSHAQMMNSAKRKKTSHAPQWRQKKVHANLLNKGCKDVDYEKFTKPLKVTEMITDFGAQLETHEASSSNGVCSQNQFSILYDLEDIDNEPIGDCNRFKDDDFCPSQRSDVNDLDQPLTDDSKDDINSSTQFVDDTGTMKTLTATRQNNIIEDSTMDNSVNDDIDRVFLPSKMPEKWGDLLDEEQEIDRDTRPRPIRSISEIREGLKTIFMELPTREMDLIETDRSLFQDDPTLPITPLHINKDKKVKIGFRHSKRSSCSSKS